MTSSNDDDTRLSFLQTIGSVFAAAFGVQSSKNRKRDFAKGNVLAFVVAGLLFTGLFVGVLVAIVHFVLAGAGAG